MYFRRIPYPVLIVFIALTLFHSVFFLDQTGPTIMPDEVSYLSQAKYFAGKTLTPEVRPYMLTDDAYEWLELPDIVNWPYYHFGYSLIVAPVYLLTDSPELAYRGVIILNSLMMSALFLILYSWIRVISDLSAGKAIVIAIIASIYPSYNFQPHIGWAENALIPFFALSVLLYTYYLRKGSMYLLVLFSVVAAFLYTLHPRGIAGSIGAIFCLLALMYGNRENRVRHLFGIIVILSMLYITKQMSGALSVLMNTIQHSGTLLDKVIHAFELDTLLQITGHFLYLILGSAGIFLFGLIFVMYRLRISISNGISELVKTPESGVYLYILISSLLLFAAGIVFLSDPAGFDKDSFNPLIDKYMYGRYNEAFLSVYLAMGLIYLTQTESFKNNLTLDKVFLVIVATCFVYSWLLSEVLSSLRGIRSLHSMAFFPWFFLSMEFTGWVKLSAIFIGPLVWMWIIYQLGRQNANKAVIAVGAYYLSMTISYLVYLSQ